MSARQQASWLPLVCICLVMSMIYFTSLGTNVVISKWIETFDTDIGFVQLVIMMTSLIGGGFMLLTSKLGEKFGKKKILATGIVIYLTGLVTALISPTQVVFFVGWAIIWPIGW
ncbi:transmembrane efflux protein [Vibrio maritimus]|uniref:Transmembrane efflux protein n=1 Tax=Vibrio maritimus TaxID=990268 RepID=A0A090T3Y4_9VIBR|nr:transmembrane efflux protein [Vibrio maritimus]